MVRTIARHKVRISVNRGAVHNLAITHVQHSMPVGGCFGIMGDHDNRLAEILIELAEKAQDGFGTLGIEVAGGFVGQDDFRFADDGASERYALLFAAGKLRGLVFQATAQAEKVGDNLEAMGIKSIAVDMLGESDVVIRIERGEQIKTLKNKTNFVTAQQSARRIAHGSEVVAVEQHAPGGSLSQAANHVQHG